MGAGYGLAMLIIYGGYTAILLAVGFLGCWLLRYPQQRRAGIVILCFLVAWCVGPPLYDLGRSLQERRAIDAANALPETLSFEGQNVLIIEAGNTICDDLCGDLVQLGVPGNFYWIGVGHYTGTADVPNPDFAILNQGDRIGAVELGDPVEALGNQRYAQLVEGVEIPAFDVVLIDDNGYLRGYAPQLLGLPDDLLSRTQVARVWLDDWRDPFSDPPPDPTYRTVAPWSDIGAFIYWPLSRNDNAYPSLTRMNEDWNALICAQAGPEAERDAFTYAFLCDQSRLAEVVEQGG